MTIQLVTCRLCRFEVSTHMIRGLGCCNDCWLETPALERLVAGPRDPWSDTYWEAAAEQAEERRMRDDTDEYFRRVNPPARDLFHGPY